MYIIGPEEIKTFEELAEWASKEENWYDVEAAKRGEIEAPGEDKRYVRFLGDLQCVFSFTVVKSTKMLYRHLSISVAAPGRMPNLHLSTEIAKMLGFTGGPVDWRFGEGRVAPEGGPRNGVILQEIPYPTEEEATLP